MEPGRAMPNEGQKQNEWGRKDGEGFANSWKHSPARLTVKLSGRPPPSDKRRRRTLSSSVGGTQLQPHHGPLQRLLDASHCSADLNSGDSVTTSTPIKRPRLSIFK
jgi:hypothetical protein